MSIGMLLISVELVMMLCILLFLPARLRGRLLHRLRDRRVAGRLGAAHRGRHLHQDRRHRLGPDEDRLQHQGGRRAQPGRHRRLHRRQRGRLGRPQRRRLRDLRRHRRRAHHLHPAGGHRRRGPGPAAGLDLRDAHHDDRRERALVPVQRGDREGALRQRRQDALRGAADPAGVGDVDGVGRDDLHRLVPAGAAPGRGRRQRQPVVEAVAHHHLRHAGGRDHPRDDQDLHVDQRPSTSRRSSRRPGKAARR